MFVSEMNSGIGKLIGSVSYELASDEACRTKAQHEVGPSPSKPSAPHKQPRQAQRKARPSRLRSTRSAQRARALTEKCGAFGMDRNEFLFAARVFEELGILDFSFGAPTLYRGAKTDLSKSALYETVRKLTEKH